MAACSAFMAAPIARFTSTPTTTSSSQFRNRNYSSFMIKCSNMSQPPQDPQQPTTTTTSTTNADLTSKPQAAAPPPPPPAPKPKVSTNFSDLLAFSGPAPERINGRLAMLGFVSAMAVELSSGQDVFTQISNGGVAAFVATSVLFTAASLVPLFKGVRAESKSNGVMTSDAELLNGRVAMLGLVALALTEFVKGSALV